jgi:hypothetical protein
MNISKLIVTLVFLGMIGYLLLFYTLDDYRQKNLSHCDVVYNIGSDQEGKYLYVVECNEEQVPLKQLGEPI